ncbi:unnamed protein product [Prorocentrum cordatum]|uniref:Uncharacterized protein n=1 Tax=Prorocentrum cordatum TaxID=2364126 RepID=A0ABN9QD37_9DINO|nr:unnamed protein product [Polarella glacialis]
MQSRLGLRGRLLAGHLLIPPLAGLLLLDKMGNIQLEVMGSLEVPPAWSPEQDRACPFRFWLTDVTLWAAAAAREFFQNSKEQLRDGAFEDTGDGNGARQLSGLLLLLLVLSKSFAPLDDESELRATLGKLGSYPKNHENIDATLSRFEVTRRRATTLGGFNMGPQGYAWMLLNAPNCSPQEWNDLLIHFRGHLPRTGQQINELVEYIKRYGQNLEKGPMAVNKNSGKGGYRGGNFFFPTFSHGGGEGQQGSSNPWANYLGSDNAEDNDTDTDEDDGEDLDGSDCPGDMGKDEDVIQQYIYHNYVFHKKRCTSSALAYGSGAINFFAAENIATNETLEAAGSKASATGSNGFVGVVIALAVAEPKMAIEDRRELEDGLRRLGAYERDPPQEAFSIASLTFTAVPPQASVTPPSATGTAIRWEQISSSPGDDTHAAVVAEQQVDLSIFDDESESSFDDEKRDLDEEVERESYGHQNKSIDFADNEKDFHGEISQESGDTSNLDSYTAPIIPDSDVPALLGNSSLKKLDVAATKTTRYMIDKLQPRPEQLDFAMAETENETKPKDQGNQGPAATGYGIYLGAVEPNEDSAHNNICGVLRCAFELKRPKAGSLC